MAKDPEGKKKSKKGKGNVLRADFTGVEEGGGGAPRMPEGDYIAEIVKTEQKESQNGNPMLVVHWKLKTGGKGDGKILRDRITLLPQTMWRLRNMLIAVGVDAPKKAVDINLDGLIGKEGGITLSDGEPYEGKIKSEVTDYIPAEDVASNGAGKKKDKGDKKKGKKKGKKQIEELDLDEV